MMDYSKPITPGGAARHVAEELEWKRKAYVHEVELLRAKIEATDDAIAIVSKTADLFDRWQPGESEDR